MTTIYLDNINKLYHQYIALDKTTLELPSGKFVVFLGPSGCGKSTTLNCIAGFENPSTGRILFDGNDVTALAPHERNIAMVFQSALLYPHLTTQRNIEMSLKHASIDIETQQNRIAKAVDMLHIGHLLDKRPGALSGGERQRVAIAKAVVREPSVFLMDEPFSALDAALRNSLRSEIVLLQKQLAVTTVFVTHDQVEAMTMGDIIVVMKDGKIQQVGSPRDIYESPANRFVASFVGTPPMNMIDGDIQQENNQYYFQADNLKVNIPAEKLPQNTTVECLGIRPHHISVVSAEQADVQARIITIERLGKENIIIANSPSGTWRAITDPYLDFSIGDNIYLQLNREHCLFF